MSNENRKNRHEFTAESAREFSTYSRYNVALLRASLPCGCEPYKDIFTFNRWRAQGFQVCKGSKAVKLALVMEREVKDKDTGESLGSRRVVGGSAVFCRCQVKPIEAEAPAPADLFEFPASDSIARAALEEVRRG